MMMMSAFVFVCYAITITVAQDGGDLYPPVVKNVDRLDIAFRVNCSDHQKQCVDGRYCGTVLKDLQGTVKDVDKAQRNYCGYYTQKYNRHVLQAEDPHALKLIHGAYPLVCCDPDDTCQPTQQTCSHTAPRLRLSDCGHTSLFYVNYATKSLLYAKEVTYNKLGDAYELGCDRAKRSANGKLACAQENSYVRPERSPRSQVREEMVPKRRRGKQHAVQRETRGRRRTKRFAGGVIARMGQFPFLAAIYFTDFPTRKKRKFGCLASIINPQIVLTTYTCRIRGSVGAVQVGFYDINKNPAARRNFTIINEVKYDLEMKPQMILAAEIYYDYHIERFNRTLMYKNNLCLIKLLTEMEFNDFVRPVCLSLKDSIEEMHYSVWAGATVYSIGYGFNSQYLIPSVPRFAKLEVQKASACKDAYIKYYDLPPNLAEPFREYLTNYYICAGGEEGVGPCTLDEGAPILKQTKCGAFFQVGMANNVFPEACAVKDRGTLIVRTDTISARAWLANASLTVFIKRHLRSDTELDFDTKNQCLSKKEKEIYSNFLGNIG